VEFLTSVSYETGEGSRRLAGRKVEIRSDGGLSLKRGLYGIDGEAGERLRYSIGLTAQMNLLGNLAVEVDAIYKPLRVAGNTTDRPTAFSVLTWQFPVLVKYGWTRHRLTPFVEAGPSFGLA